MSVENGVPELQRHSLVRNGDDPIGEGEGGAQMGNRTGSPQAPNTGLLLSRGGHGQICGLGPSEGG